MRKTAGITLTAIVLMFGGAGVANAAAPSAPIRSSTTTTLADDTNTNHHDSDKTGLWGLAGLLGLGGLAGLMRRKDTDVAARRTAGPSTPRV
jgi:MYXO-CTERM domain-containing protein